ncbi:hypothetical protein A2U01_0013279 [Trifolium medium]|uniref:Uncharacterized protein n=1 Tax=Trifolium medium TaxID=97028 RepID=A0A392MYF1_9FABA|nr:hypothetical protein [Trifolium medium]
MHRFNIDLHRYINASGLHRDCFWDSCTDSCWYAPVQTYQLHRFKTSLHWFMNTKKIIYFSGNLAPIHGPFAPAQLAQDFQPATLELLAPVNHDDAPIQQAQFCPLYLFWAG